MFFLIKELQICVILNAVNYVPSVVVVVVVGVVVEAVVITGCGNVIGGAVTPVSFKAFFISVK